MPVRLPVSAPARQVARGSGWPSAHAPGRTCKSEPTKFDARAAAGRSARSGAARCVSLPLASFIRHLVPIANALPAKRTALSHPPAYQLGHFCYYHYSKDTLLIERSPDPSEQFKKSKEEA